MMEGAFSLMQMAKISSFLNRLSEAKIPFISLCTDPTFGGTTASFAMLGDINISEPDFLFSKSPSKNTSSGLEPFNELPQFFSSHSITVRHGINHYSLLLLLDKFILKF